MSEIETIRVMLVDDHDMVRRGLAVFIHGFDDFELVGEASDGEEAIAMVPTYEPDVILMDIQMPNTTGIEATKTIRSQYPDVQIIALTSFKDEELVRSAMEAGAIGYLIKNSSVQDIAAAIRQAAHGVPTLSTEATRALIKAATQPRRPGYDLTDREYDVLALLVQGMNNSQIADKLFVGRSTVKTHVSNILSKLGVSNRLEAATLAIEYDLVDLKKD